MIIFGVKYAVLSHFNTFVRLWEYYLDVLVAFLNHETHSYWARTAKTDGLCRKTFQKVLKNSKNRVLSHVDGFERKSCGFSHFVIIMRLLRCFPNVLEAFLNHETHPTLDVDR